MVKGPSPPYAAAVPVAVLAVGCSILGLLVGSFVNVVVWRVPRGESIVRPGSRCPSCQRSLRSRELVPVVSWVVQRGRCRGCGATISWRYPLVEVLTGGLFCLLALRFGWSWALPAYLFLVAALVALSFIDLDTRTLPRRIIWLTGVAGLVLLGVAAMASGEEDRLWRALLGAAGALAVFLLLWFVAPGSMGYGDVRLAALLGLYLGWLGLGYVPIGLFLAFVYGAVVGIALLVGGRAGRNTAVPFGPFLALGAITAILLGGPILELYGV